MPADARALGELIPCNDVARIKLSKIGGRLPRIRRYWGGPRGGPSGLCADSRREATLPKTIVIVKRPDGSGCVGRPVVKCREAPLLFSAVNLRSLDPRAR